MVNGNTNATATLPTYATVRHIPASGHKWNVTPARQAALLQRAKKRSSLCLELLIFGIPFRIVRRIDHLLQLCAGILTTAVLREKLGEKEMRRRAAGVVGQRRTEVRLGSLLVPAEQSRHFRVPAAEGPVRALEEMRPSAFDSTTEMTPCQLLAIRLVSMNVAP